MNISSAASTRHKGLSFAHNFFNYGLTGASALILLCLASCKSDDKLPLPDVKTSTFTSSALTLNYDGEAMPGKSVDLKPHASDSSKADLILYSQFDLSQLSGMGLTGKIAGPGVIPGTPTLTLPIEFQAGNGLYSFSGQYSTSEASFSYSGLLEAEHLTLDITDARLASQAFAGTVLVPAPIEKTGLADYTSLPFHLVWELDPAAGIDIPLSGLLKAMVTAPVIPVYQNTAYMSLAQAYYSVVKSVAMNPDGNFPIMYVSTLGGAAHLATTTGNMLQYVPGGDGIRLYVNPLSALSEVLLALSVPQEDAEFVTKATGDASGDATGIALDPAIKEALLKSLLYTIAPSLSEGIPLAVEPTTAGADIYFDTQTSVTFLASLLQNVLSNPEISAALKGYLAGLDIPQLPAEDIDAILVQLPTFLTKTTRLEIGLSFIEKK